MTSEKKASVSDYVDAAKQSVMGCKTGFIGQTMKQAIPSDLISFL